MKKLYFRGLDREELMAVCSRFKDHVPAPNGWYHTYKSPNGNKFDLLLVVLGEKNEEHGISSIQTEGNISKKDRRDDNSCGLL